MFVVNTDLNPERDNLLVWEDKNKLKIKVICQKQQFYRKKETNNLLNIVLCETSVERVAVFFYELLARPIKKEKDSSYSILYIRQRTQKRAQKCAKRTEPDSRYSIWLRPLTRMVLKLSFQKETICWIQRPLLVYLKSSTVPLRPGCAIALLLWSPTRFISWTCVVFYSY